jgi:hypothetical protein
MKKYYYWSIAVNFIPVIISFILFHGYQDEGIIPLYMSIMFLLFWILIYLFYFICDIVENRIIKRIFVYFPSFVGTIAYAWYSQEIGFYFIYGFLLYLLPSVLYNVFVDYKLKKEESSY